MNKADLITSLKNETDLSKSEAESVVNLFFDQMMTQRVAGTLKAKETRTRQGTSIKKMMRYREGKSSPNKACLGKSRSIKRMEQSRPNTLTEKTRKSIPGEARDIFNVSKEMLRIT